MKIHIYKFIIKKFVFVCILFFMFSNILAQDRFSIGMGYVMQRTFMHNKNDSDAGNNIDYSPTFHSGYGLFFEKKLNNKNSLQYGVYYLEKGQKYTGSFEYYECTDVPPIQCYIKTALYENSIAIASLEIPISLKQEIFSRKWYKNSFLLGPKLIILRNVKFSSISDKPIYTFSSNISQYYKYLVASIKIGFDNEFYFLKKNHFVATLYFDYCLSDIEKKDKNYNYPFPYNAHKANYNIDFRPKTHLISISLSVHFVFDIIK